LLKNQVEQTEWLASRAPDFGAECASAFGAGFGGSVWALVSEAQAVGFLSRWRDGYLEAYPEHTETAEFLITRPGPAAFEITLTQTT
jgi:galactokinase